MSCFETFNSKLAITVTKKSDMEYFIKMYDLNSYEQVFAEKVGGKPDCYIKCKEIE